MFTQAQKLKLAALTEASTDLVESANWKPTRKGVIEYQFDHPEHGKHKVLWNPEGWTVLNMKSGKILATKIYDGLTPSDPPNAVRILSKGVHKIVDDYYK